MSLTIAVITPSFNQGKYIERTIQSVLTQTDRPISYYVIDGGSTDETAAILSKYQDQVMWISEKDDGQANAVNKGIQMSSSDIVGWLNSDDIYYPDTVSKVCYYFEQHPDVDVVYGMTNNIDQYDRVISAYPTEAWEISRLKKTCYISQPSVFFRRSVVSRFGLLDERLHYCLDYEFWLRLALAGAKFSYLPITLSGSRIYPETKTSSSPLEASIETVRMIRNKLNFVPSDWLINHALLYTKKQSLSRIKIVNYVKALVLASGLSMQMNGVLRGLFTLLIFPKTAFEMFYNKK